MEPTGALGSEQFPIEEKEALVGALRAAIAELCDFCAAREVDLDKITKLRKFEWTEALNVLSEERVKGVARFAREDHAIGQETVAHGIRCGAVLSFGGFGTAGTGTVGA